MVQTTAVLSGLVPYGLFFLVAVAYTVGAAKSSDAAPWSSRTTPWSR
ncbi:MAG: hypothetical protein M3P89_06400 [Actinomycetota bacterium]|nr:hypothetical protein [Actinomycetota bacterium]